MKDNFLLGRCQKEFSEFNPEKVILIGAGAIIDSWLPLLNVFLRADNISDICRKAYTDEDRNNQMASYLAQCVYHFHSFCIAKNKLKTDYSLPDVNTQYLKYIENEIVKVYRNDRNFLHAIGKIYSETKLTPQKEIDFILKNIDDNTGVIVLNWDETIWNMCEAFPNILQLHGRASYPDTLILPMEVCLEKVNYHGSIENINDRYDILSLGSVHQYALDWLCSAQEVIIWGVAFNIYESELNILIESAFQNRKSKISVTNINPNEQTNYSISRLFNISFDEIKKLKT